MSTEAVLGIIVSVLLLVLAGMASLMLAHFKDCRDFRVKQAEDQGKTHALIERMAKDIGDGDTGLRGSVHKLRNEVSPVMTWAQGEMERKRGSR